MPHFNTQGNAALSTSVCGNSILALLDAAGVSWKDYGEGYGSTGCTDWASDRGDLNDTGNIYVRRHNAGAMFADVSTDCGNGFVANFPIGSPDTGDQHLPIDSNGSGFSGATLPQLSIVVPDNCHEMHTSAVHCVRTTSPTWDEWGTFTDNGTGPEGGTNNGLNIVDCANTGIWDAAKHCSAANKASQFAGDYMLSKLIPDLATDVGPTGVVLVVWDESSSNTSTLQIDDNIPAIVIPGRDSNGNYQTLDATTNPPSSSTRYDQASVLRAVADAYGVSCASLGTAGNSLGQTQCTNATPLPLKLTVNDPTITSLSVSHGRVGDNVTITGTNLAWATSVSFNGTAASFTANADNTTISTTVPAGGSTGAISVTTPASTATSSTFTHDVPVVSSFSNDHGNPGTSVTLTGSNFTGATSVKLNGTTASFSVTDDSHISTSVPAGATSGVWTVVTPTGSGSSSTYTVPSVTVIGTNSGSSATAPNVNTSSITATGDTVIALISSSTGNTGTSARPTGFAATKETNGVAADACANCASITSGTNLSFTLTTATNWTLTILDVKGLATSAVDLTASYTSNASTVTTLDSGLTGTTTQASEVVIAGLMEASNQTPTLCSPSCTGTFSSVNFQVQGTSTGLQVADAFPSATSSFEAFGTISSASKARGVIVTLK